MKLAPNVDSFSLKPEALIGLLVLDNVFRLHGLELLITSVYRPGPGQMLHGRGYAADIRLPSRSGGQPRDDAVLLPVLFEALGGVKPSGQFDLIHEVGVVGGDHYHLEYDPANHPEVKANLV